MATWTKELSLEDRNFHGEARKGDLRCGEPFEGAYLVYNYSGLILADISMACTLYWGIKFIIDREMRHMYPHIMEWYSRTSNDDGVKEAFGKIDLIEKRQRSPQ